MSALMSMLDPQTALWLALAIPIAAIPLMIMARNAPDLRETVSLAAGAALFVTVLNILGPVLDGARPEITLIEMMPGLAIRLSAEPLGMIFACIASGLWVVTTVYAIGYMRGHNEDNQTRFYTCFAIAISSAMGIALAGNLLTLFVFYEILTFSTYPLVTHAGTDKAKQGGRVYLGILVGTSVVFQMPAIIWTYHLAGTLDFTVGGILTDKADPALLSVLLLLFVFGIGKAALMPFHRWLPAAMVAPTPVSALLHAVAVVKAGVFSVLKVAVYVFGLDLLQTLSATQFLMWLAAGTILIASLVAMRQDNLKRRLAYSTISQLSYIVLAAMLATEQAIIGGGMHIVMHAFGKITLFFCAGAILVAAHKSEVSQLDGIGRRMPITMLAFLVGAISIIGLPPFGGVWSKWFIAMGALDAGYQAMVAVLMISSLLNVAYLLPIPARAFFAKERAPIAGGSPASDGHHDHHHDHGEAPVAILIAQSFTATGCLVLFFFPEPIFDLLALLFDQ